MVFGKSELGHKVYEMRNLQSGEKKLLQSSSSGKFYDVDGKEWNVYGLTGYRVNSVDYCYLESGRE